MRRAPLHAPVLHVLLAKHVQHDGGPYGCELLPSVSPLDVTLTLLCGAALVVGVVIGVFIGRGS